MNEAIVLGFDYGRKRTGVAVGQTITRSANPLGIIKTPNNKSTWNEISQLINQWNPGLIVVGFPITIEGTRQKMTEYAEKFAHQLHVRYQHPIKMIDERLSSYEAKRQEKHLQYVDHIAAKIIIEAWFSTLTDSNNK